MSTLDTQAASTGGEAPPGVMRARFVLGIILVATLAALAYGVQPLWEQKKGQNDLSIGVNSF